MRRILFSLVACAVPLALFAAEPPAKPAASAAPAAHPDTKAAASAAPAAHPDAKSTDTAAKVNAPAAPAAPAEKTATPSAKPATPATAPATLAAEPPAPPRENKVDYLSLPTGTDWERFNAAYPGFAEKTAGTFFDLEKKAKTDFTLTIKRPRGFDGFDRFIRRIPVAIAALGGTERCGKPVEGTFLAVPHKGGDRRVLYSYRYLVCADDPLVSPVRFLDKYMEKYGLYDVKDFDRNQHTYYGVQGRYEVRVRPVKEGKLAALEIGVADNAVFNEAYKAWRARLRSSEEATKEKF